MKERILIAIKDDKLREGAASILYKHHYLVTKVSALADLETQLNTMPQDLILLESAIWAKDKPHLLSDLGEKRPIVHILSAEDEKDTEPISKNGAVDYLSRPVSDKEILLMVNQAVKYNELKQRSQQMRHELLEANKNLSAKTRELKGLTIFNENIIESVDVGILTIDSDYKITSWNSRLTDITGIEKTKAIKADVFDILPWLAGHKVPGKDESLYNDEVIDKGVILDKDNISDTDEILDNDRIPNRKDEIVDTDRAPDKDQVKGSERVTDKDKAINEYKIADKGKVLDKHDIANKGETINKNRVSVDIRDVRDVLLVITEGKQIGLSNLKGIKGDGSVFFADYKLSPIKEADEIIGAVVTVNDVTQKVHFKEEQINFQRYISNLVGCFIEPIISYDTEGMIITWNKGAEVMFGYTEQEAIGRSWELLAGEDEAERKKLINMFQWVKQSKSLSNSETVLMNKSGASIPVSMTISLVSDAEGRIYGLSSIIRDISQNKGINKQLIQSHKGIALNIMVDHIARDIKNPIDSLSTTNTLLLNPERLNSIRDINQYLAKIESSAQNVIRLTKDLLWYAEPSLDQMRVYDVHEILDRAILFLGLLVDSRGVQFERLYTATDKRVVGDCRYLIQMFLNLFTNAVTAMPEGGTISILTENPVEDGSPGGEECISIAVMDTGIGIKEKDRDKVFEQFFTSTTGGRGCGLGLYIVDQIVKLHRGEIKLESEIKKGACFTIRLPLHKGIDGSIPDPRSEIENQLQR